jgi:VWFA-related protein
MKHFVAPLALLVALGGQQSTQDADSSRPRTVASAPAADRVELAVDLVVTDAQVVEKDTAKIVGGLKKEDFVIYEDGVRQQLAHFGQGTLPLSVILMIDRAGCLDPINSKVREATLEALGRLKPQDEVALMAYAEHTELVQRFSLDHAAVAAAFDRMPPHHEEAEHCLNVAVDDASDYMRQASNPYGRRVIIFVTGITRAADCGDPSNKEALDDVFESGSVVCAILPRSAGQRMENGATIGILAAAGAFGLPTTKLEKFAEETGGEIVSAKTEDLNASFDGLIERLRTRYTLGFVSTNTKFDGSFRKLKVELTPEATKRVGKKVVVQTRRGYVATPPVVSRP